MASLLADVHLAYHALRRIVGKQLDEAGVSMSEALVLRVVDLNPKVTVHDLLDVTGLSKSTMTTLLGRLEDREYLYREELPGDLRFTRVRLTHVGSGIAKIVEQLLDDVDEGLTVQVPDAQHGCISILASGLSEYDRRGLIRRMD